MFEETLRAASHTFALKKTVFVQIFNPQMKFLTVNEQFSTLLFTSPFSTVLNIILCHEKACFERFQSVYSSTKDVHWVFQFMKENFLEMHEFVPEITIICDFVNV